MAEPYRDARHALDSAMDAASVAHDVCRVLFLALGDPENVISDQDRVALRTIALYGEEKAVEAQEAADEASMMVLRGQTGSSPRD